jgi:hypothetical protein
MRLKAQVPCRPSAATPNRRSSRSSPMDQMRRGSWTVAGLGRHVAVSSCATCCCNSVKLVRAGVGSSDGPFRPAVPGAAMARPISQAHADPCARFEAAKMSWIEPAEGPRPAQSFKTNRSGASRQIGPKYGTQRSHEEPRRERPFHQAWGDARGSNRGRSRLGSSPVNRNRCSGRHKTPPQFRRARVRKSLRLQSIQGVDGAVW